MGRRWVRRGRAPTASSAADGGAWPLRLELGLCPFRVGVGVAIAAMGVVETVAAWWWRCWAGRDCTQQFVAWRSRRHVAASILLLPVEVHYAALIIHLAIFEILWNGRKAELMVLYVYVYVLTVSYCMLPAGGESDQA